MPVTSAEALQELVQRVYVAHGVPDQEAQVVSRHQVRANLAGHDSHGVLRTAQHIASIAKGDVVPGAAFDIERETSSTAVIDGHWGLGYVMTERAMELAIGKAIAHGTAAVVIRRQGHIGRLATYASMAAERGLIAMLMSDSGRGPKMAAPFGGSRALLGSNPLCIAVPTSRHGPVVLDMATSAVALGKIQLARTRGERVPLGWIIDRDGQPTDNPEDFYAGGALLPLGGDQGHKGYGLSFMVEVMCGLLTGLGHGVAADGRHNDGNFIAVHDPGCFIDPQVFTDEVSDFIDYLKDGARDGDEVLFPGEREQRTMLQRQRDGIYVEDSTWESLQNMTAPTQ